MYAIIILLLIVGMVALYDLIQRNHTILRNYPIVGHFRYWIERFGPEIRQYIIANDREEQPFNRRSRAWVYATSKGESNVFGFGTDADLDKPGHVIIRPSIMPASANAHAEHEPRCAKIMGPNRRKPYRPSIIGISGMSYGALSGAAVSALNQGAKMAGVYQNTGEGGLSEFHKSGADIIFQIGTAYNGVRNEDGTFSRLKLKMLIDENPFIRAIEIKLSQGAKPGKGGILPGVKVSVKIAAARGIKAGQDSISPPRHSAFNNIRELVDFIEELAELTGLPVGIKSAVGRLEDWDELASIMASTGRGPDFITIDGGEGGTGAAPISFADNMALPFNEAFTSVRKIFARHNIERVVFVGSAKLGIPSMAIKAYAMGVDVVNVGREALFSLGCIQAQKCHTNTCPASIATQDPRRERNLDVKLKSVRCKNYLKGLMKEVYELTIACGYQHPSQIRNTDVLLATSDAKRYKTIKELFYDNSSI